MILLGSCKSYKDLILVSDLESQEEVLSNMPKDPPVYHIKKNDNLYVSILSQNPEMNILYNPAMAQAGGVQTGTQQMYGDLSSQYLNGYQVDENGNINLPILGKIDVEGTSIPVAESRILIKALEYLKSPTVKVKLLNYKITVLGEVKMPGTYYNYDKSISVLDAISMANGNTDFAQLDRVLVMRHTDKGTEIHRINLLSSNSLLNSKAYFLQPDDIVYVEPGKNKNTGLRSQAALLALSVVTTVTLVISFIYNISNN
jgi:polysaccharide export outer membrane protein